MGTRKLWTAADTQAVLFDTATTTALTAGAVVASAASKPDNRTVTTARRIYCLLELTCTWTVAPAVNDAVDVYLVPSADGGNTAHGDTTDPINSALRIASIPVRAVTTAQKIPHPVIIQGPFDFKCCVRNSTGQTMPAGWGLKITTFDEDQP